jgi:hypothetical protein
MTCGLLAGLPVDERSAEKVAEIVKLDLMNLISEDMRDSKLPQLDQATAKGILERVRLKNVVHACDP